MLHCISAKFPANFSNPQGGTSTDSSAGKCHLLCPKVAPPHHPKIGPIHISPADWFKTPPLYRGFVCFFFFFSKNAQEIGGPGGVPIWWSGAICESALFWDDVVGRPVVYFVVVPESLIIRRRGLFPELLQTNQLLMCNF